MKPSQLLAPLATLTTLALLSCDNPADHTTDAKIADPVAKETSEAPAESTKYVFTDKSAIGFIGSSYNVTGNLDLHGVTKSITFPAAVSKEGDLVKINAEFDINRFDFDIQFPGKTDDLIRPEVVLNFALEAKPE